MSADVENALNTSRGFDENISPYLKYSLPETDEINEKSLFKYTEEQYNSFGWVRYENIISHKMLQMLTSKIYELTEQKIWFHKTTDGQYIIPISEDYGLYDVLVYVNDDPITPKISKIIKFVEDEMGYIEEIWRSFLNGKITEANVRTAISYVNEIVGDGYIKQYYAENRTPFQTYDNERSRRKGTEKGGEIGGGDQSTFKRYDIRRTADTESDGDTKENTAADLKRSAFSLPKEKYSLPETDEMLRKQNEQLLLEVWCKREKIKIQSLSKLTYLEN